MERDLIIQKIEELINGDLHSYEFPKNTEVSVREDYLYNVLIRFSNTHKKYLNGEAGKSDYLSVIREFLMAYKAEVRINDSGLVDNNQFGLKYNSESGKYYSVYDIPQEIKYKQFVEDAFINTTTEVKKTESRYNLQLNRFLKDLTGNKYVYFKSFEQKLCIYGALFTPASYTTLISMPTGGGKSLITQALSYEKKGLTIVIIPTTSLALDQERAATNNIKISKENEIFSYRSGADNITQIRDAIKKQTARLLFISPEALLKNESFREIIDEANALHYIKNIIIDEAHIVVAWGDFFRVDYQCLGPWRRDLMKKNPEIRTFLLSATFTDRTVDALKKMFSSNDKYLEIRCDSLRKEPRFSLIRVKNKTEKENMILELVNKLPKPMILYVNSPYDAEEWRRFFRKKNYYNIKTYTGETGFSDRRTLIDDWTNNQYEIMIATCAFGVGVNKPDIRTVIHLYLPESPDAYYQELGRGGRDGLPCLSIMCITDDDIKKAFNHVGKVLTTEKLDGRWWSMYYNHPKGAGGGKDIVLLASTKPNYSKENYFEEGNDTDQKWNINALLLLNRHGIIKIMSLDQDANNRYIFTIRVLNDLILTESEESKKLFDDIREKESAMSLSAYNVIKKSIENEGKICWSEMFYQTYLSVPGECCSGCGQHDYAIELDKNVFPLCNSVCNPQKELSDNIKQLFSDTNDILIFSGILSSETIHKYNPDVVVCDQENSFDDVNNPNLFVINFREYADLMRRKNYFYISGLIIVQYSNDPKIAKDQYQIIKKYRNANVKVIHISLHDFTVSEINGRTISSDIDGRIIK